MDRLIKVTLICQLLGFAIHGWVVGGIMEARVQREQAFSAQVLLKTPAKELSELEI